MQKYTKTPVEIKYREDFEDDYVEIQAPTKTSRLTLWDLLVGIGSDVKHLIISSKIAGFAIPASLIIIGSTIIFRQVWPQISDYVKYRNGYYDNYTTALVEGDYVERVEYVSNPGADYFKQLRQTASNGQFLVPDPVANQYKEKFSLSIPSLDLHNLPVQANVNSGVKEAYNTVLKQGLAHFDGTNLPISDVKWNTVIYGHSAGGGLYDRTKDPSMAFTKLMDIKIGDEVNVEIEGKTYKYRVQRSKVVQPDDVSIISGGSQETLTLFTCYPPGNNNKRFVVIAKPVNT